MSYLRPKGLRACVVKSSADFLLALVALLILAYDLFQHAVVRGSGRGISYLLLFLLGWRHRLTRRAKSCVTL